MGSGGKRKGSGRKAEYGEVKQGRTTKLTPTLWAFLDEQTDSGASVIEAAMRRTKAFRDWEKSRG